HWLETRDPAHTVLARQLLESSPLARMLRSRADHLLTEQEEELCEALLAQALSGHARLDGVVAAVFDKLLAIGRDPAGPGGSLIAPRRHEWWQAYDWQARPPRPRGHEPRIGAHRQSVREPVAAQGPEALFSGARRDIESLGIAYALPAADHAPAPPAGYGRDTGEQIVAGAIRKLGLQRFYENGRQGRSPLDPPPEALKSWLAAVAARHGRPEEGLLD